MERRLLLLASIILIIISSVGCVRKFRLNPQLMSYDFEVAKSYDKINYTPVVDAREEFDKKGKTESSCSGGKSGITHLGDKNYEKPLITEFDKHLKLALRNSDLFSDVVESDSIAVDYTFYSTLEKYHVTLDEAKAQQTQACIGGLLGSAIASTVDVTATTDIQLTGRLTHENEEIWRKTVAKQIISRDDYGNTKKNTEQSMGEAIGEVCKDLITEMAKYLSSAEK